jgi:hypothetical protein
MEDNAMTERQPTPGMHELLAANFDESGHGSGMGFGPAGTDDEQHLCAISQVPFKQDDLCATDITEGTCHAACSDDSPVVDLGNGKRLTDGKADTCSKRSYR